MTNWVRVRTNFALTPARKRPKMRPLQIPKLATAPLRLSVVPLLILGREFCRPSVDQSRQNYREHVVSDNEFAQGNPVKHET